MIKKKVVFGSSMCPDCIVMKEALDERGVKYLYLDITENLANLTLSKLAKCGFI